MRTVLTLLALLAAATSTLGQWTLETSNTTADLRGIHSIGGGVAWASGTNGTVLRTEDGGYVWQSCSIPPGAEKLDFRGIQAFDANTAIVMSSGKGDQSRLYKTADGCHSSKLLFTNPDKDGFWDAVQAQGPDHLLILGDPVNDRFVIGYPHENGFASPLDRHYQETLSAPPGAGAFAASNSALTIASNALNSNVPNLQPKAWFGTSGPGSASVYYLADSYDEGSSDALHAAWHRVSVPIVGNSASCGVFSLAFGKKGIGVAVGGDYTKPDEATASAAWSVDGGKTWLPAQTPPHGYRSAVAYDPTTKTWITVGPNGTDVSTDDGKNWHALHPDPALHEPPDADRSWNALSLPFVVGPHGRIGKVDKAALKH